MKDAKAPGRRSTVERREFLKAGIGAGAVMAALKGRGAAAQSQARTPVSIDLHTHWTPQPYIKALADAGHSNPNPRPMDFDLDLRRKWMDDHGVLMHVLTLSGGAPWQWAQPEAALRLAQAVNDAAVEGHTAFPDRFLFGISIPVRDPVASLKEINRMAGKPGMKAVHLPNSIESHDYLFEPAFAPIFARCEELGYPLLFHPLDGELNFYGGPRLAGLAGLNNTLGFPFEHATTAAKFITTGTLDRFPRLDVVLPHSGGAFPYLAGRIAHGLGRPTGEKNPKLARPFREYIRRFHYDTLAFYPETLRFLITLVGSDRVVIGTDNFAAMDVEQPNALVEELNLPAADRDRIFRGNAMKLFRL
jgi:aminocarboxymuconate-semialdehyde decarboxylase